MIKTIASILYSCSSSAESLKWIWPPGVSSAQSYKLKEREKRTEEDAACVPLFSELQPKKCKQL